MQGDEFSCRFSSSSTLGWWEMLIWKCSKYLIETEPYRAYFIPMSKFHLMLLLLQWCPVVWIDCWMMPCLIIVLSPLAGTNFSSFNTLLAFYFKPSSLLPLLSLSVRQSNFILVKILWVTDGNSNEQIHSRQCCNLLIFYDQWM